jgi:hypothetical protein
MKTAQRLGEELEVYYYTVHVGYVKWCNIIDNIIKA